MASGTAELLQAHLYEVEGQLKLALQSLQQATQMRPPSERAWLELSGFYLRFGKLDDADKPPRRPRFESRVGGPHGNAPPDWSHRLVGSRDTYPLVKVLTHTPRRLSPTKRLLR